MHEFTDVVVVKFKIVEGKKVGNIIHITSYEIVHSYDMVTFS